MNKARLKNGKAGQLFRIFHGYKITCKENALVSNRGKQPVLVF